MTIAIVGAEASTPIRWWCTVCDDQGVISNWAATPYDLRRRRLSVAGDVDVDEVIVSDKTAAALRELVLLDPDCERLVFGMRAHPDGAVLLASADDLEELIGFVAAEANHEPNRRRQHRLDAAFNALTEAAQTHHG
jgi:3-methyladenine DNA glycosylase/8-oxoguanine DNA glycosylase